MVSRTLSYNFPIKALDSHKSRSTGTGTASINLTPSYRGTNRGRSDVLLDSRRLLQRSDEMLKLKGKKNYENRAIGHDTSERYESLFSFDRNNIGHFRRVLDLGAIVRCLCTTRKCITTRRLESTSRNVCSYFLFSFKNPPVIRSKNLCF